MTHLIWSCECGQVEAEVPSKGNRIICYCDSCRTYVEKLGKGDRLVHPGSGNELFQTSPQGVRFKQGTERLRYMRLTEKGPLRWYASCCNTPVANTLSTRTLPFASFQVHDFEDKSKLPPVRAHVNLSGATAHVPKPHGSFYPLVFDILKGAAKAYLTGRVRQNPFFDASGQPVGARQDL